MNGVIVFAILALVQPSYGQQTLDQAEKEEKRLLKDKANLNDEIRLLEQESARIQKKLAEKQAVIQQLKAELAELQKQHATHTATLKTAEKGEADADKEQELLTEELKVTRAAVEKITVEASLATVEYEKKRDALLTKKADLMAQKAMFKRRTDEHQAATKAHQDESAALERDIAKLSQVDEPAKTAKRKVKKRRPSSAEPVAEKPAAVDEYAPRDDKSQRLFTIDNK